MTMVKTEMEAKAIELAEWLQKFPKTQAKAVIVKVKRKEYPGVHFVQKREYDKQPYNNVGIMLLGPLPRCYRRNHRVCFTFSGEPHEWYVSAYYDGKPTTMQPYGKNFIIAPWDDQSGQLIDYYEKKKYQRQQIVVNWLDTTKNAKTQGKGRKHH